MLLTEMKDAIVVSLGDTPANIDDSYVTQAIHQAVQDITRITPREKLHEARVSYVITDESFTADIGVAVQLNNQFIHYDSEQVWTATGQTGTRYTRNTDYTMNYTTGQITALSTGSMSEVAHYITYDTSRVSIGIGSLTDLIRVVQVEHPIGNVPQTFVPFTTWSDRLHIIGTVDTPRTQVRLPANSHILVYYHAHHTCPTAASRASYSPFIDEVSVLGASGYVLAYISMQMLRLALTSITYCTAIITSATDQLTFASTTLDLIATKDILVESGAGTDSAKSKLKTASELVTKGPGETADSAKAALVNAEDELDDVAHDVTGEITLAADIWTAVSGPQAFILGQAAPAIKGAQPYLEDGDAYINTVNTGSDVAALYQRYAETEATIARLLSERVSAYLTAAQVRTAVASTYVQEASEYNAAAQTLIGYANSAIGIAQALSAQSNMRNVIASGHIATAQQHIATAEQYKSLSEKYQLEASRRLSEFWRILNDRAQTIRDRSIASTRQPY